MQQDQIGTLTFKRIGVIHTPYQDAAPYQPVDDDQECYLIIDDDYVDGIYELEKFRYIYVIYYIHRVTRDVAMRISPPWAGRKEVGLFASRSPVRPNPIGLSIVQIKKIVGNRIMTSGLDAFDGTPILDIKPYIKDLDSKPDANTGWVDELGGDSEHLTLHIRGIPHDY